MVQSHNRLSAPAPQLFGEGLAGSDHQVSRLNRPSSKLALDLRVEPETVVATVTQIAQLSDRLGALADRYRPRIIAIAGITAYRTAFGHPHAANGPQPDSLGPARIWVVPNPSGLNAHTSVPLLAQELRKLRETLDDTELPRPGRSAMIPARC